ncbi:MAG: beta-ketoacyl synthase N-terminal-like domain-containing protein, partial [Gammaproteobacteria bacterium]|nr:beta-ketoacyl synthase N-terminal-like domain-containing protein [Gammaproteobacteria bacterium]
RAFAGEYVASNTAVFDYPDITQLAGHMAEQLGDLGTAPAPQAEPTPEPRPQPGPRVEPRPQPGAAAPREEDGIAIVGMACRFPGAPDLAAFWRQLEDGGTGITDGRAGSGPWSDGAGDLPPEFAAYRKGGFVDEIDKFDARFFRIAPIEARMLDPRQRMLLETSWQALEDAGMDSDRLRGSRTGIYVGLASSEYRDLMKTGDRGVSYLGTATSMTVGRVAYHLGLEGPAVPVELNCASSLIAAHQAVMALRYGEVDQALVGGVNTLLSPAVTREMAELGMLSRQGQCKAFDASADGFVRSEGCGMLMLKRLDEAEADGDRVWAVIRGSAVNQNGASAGPTTPNGLAQRRVIETALSRANMQPSAVDYLEAHGAGSALGDPIEVQAAAAVYGTGRESDRPLLIGSVKANIGHLEAAAGVAGLIKAVLAMKRGMIPGQLHFHDPNPNLDWDELPVRVVSDKTPWPGNSERPPRSGVSAFGISGTNAHVVLEGHAANGTGPGGAADPAGALMRVSASEPERFAELEPSNGEDARDRSVRMLPLSGKSEDALRQLAERYLEWLDRRSEETLSELDMAALLADMAWTAAVGRTHFDCRAGLVFEDAESLRQELKSLANGGAGQGKRATGASSAAGPESAKLRSLVEAVAKEYEAGASVSFDGLFAGEERRRISVPGYPFQRLSYWINS